MVRVTSDAFHEKLTAGTDEIVLNGPPDDLRGSIMISNKHDDVLKVKSLPLAHDKKLFAAIGQAPTLKLSARLNPGEQKLVELRHQISSTTAPGVYENTMMVGGEQRKVKIIVQSVMSIEVYPDHFVFAGCKPGTVHTAMFTLTNTGNMPFQVPDVRHVAALDMDMLCRAFGIAMRSGASVGAVQALDEVAKNIQEHLPDWADSRVEERGKTVEPGGRMLVHVHITMPKNSDPAKDYSGSMRFWDREITYSIKAQY